MMSLDSEVTQAAKASIPTHENVIEKNRDDYLGASSNRASIELAPVKPSPDINHDGDDEPLQKTYPSDDDLRNLRRVAGKLPWTTFTVAFVELCERFSYYGTTAVCKWRLELYRHRRS